MTQTFTDRLRNRQPVVGTWISIGHPAVAEIAGRMGYDFGLIDTEHTTISLETLQSMVHALEATDGTTSPVARVPWNDDVRIKRVLDTGVSGIQVPMIETRRAAEEAVAATRYPPEGNRGIAGSRAAGYGLDLEEYVTGANDRIAVVLQIETERGVENSGAIADVDGVAALFVGPADLSADLGIFGEWDTERFNDALDDVVEAAHAADTAVGTLALQPEDVSDRIEQGFDFVIAGKDTANLTTRSREMMDAFDRSLASRAAPDGDG